MLGLQAQLIAQLRGRFWQSVLGPSQSLRSSLKTIVSGGAPDGFNAGESLLLQVDDFKVFHDGFLGTRRGRVVGCDIDQENVACSGIAGNGS